ncbi:hypothetical protein LZ906_005235 [Paraclostridium ghonii]|uniref:hypothetical protein n=1 Tax=Paraclostridium ghonii TaxID=29358 RepID=UPI00202CEBD0|nr:hypothetical protein [Paeniclostridium ghonii]MCM0165698.1 hypothetical protein [Paeniclostridium ghonii]
MSCKKNGWNECEDINKWENICYYKCKDNGCVGENCKNDIEKTEKIIDSIKVKNEQLGNDLKDAKDNQNKVKSALVGINDNVGNLATNLGEIENALAKAAYDLKSIMEELEKAVPAQNEAIKDIKDAQDKQKDIKGLVNDLDKSFEKTVNCLKRKDKPPVLIPWNECDDESENSGCECD